MEEIDGWRVERVLAEDGDVHAYAVVRGEQRARLDIVAQGRSSTLLHAATAHRTLVVRGKHDGRAYVVTTEAAPRKKSKSLVVPIAIVVVLAVGGVVAYVMRPTTAKPPCADCVLIVDGAPVSTTSFKIYAADPYLFPDRHGIDRQKAALDLLIVKTVLLADADVRKVSVDAPASETENAIGLRTFDIREKLAADGDPYDEKTIDRYAKAVGLATRAELLAVMRDERRAMAARDGRTDAQICKGARVIAVARVDGYVPCATLK